MILLIGNFLSRHGFNPTAIEELDNTLSTTYIIKSASHRRNSLLRLLDMLLLIILNRNSCRLIIVDVFSTNAFYYSCIAILLAKIGHIPYLSVMRGGNMPERYKKQPKLFNFLFKKNNIIICPSNYLADFFINRKYRVQIIHNYIDIRKYIMKKRDKIEPNLLWVRSIHSIYNPVMAIKVLFEICKKFPSAHLCMIGPAKDETVSLVEKLIDQLNLRKNVTLTGQLKKKEWIELSNEYDIFLNTTNYDNQPITIIEAMALGLPIVSTNVGGIPNLLSHNKTAKLVGANDVSAMVSQIMDYLSNDHQRIQISTNAREIVEKKYCQEIIIPKWYETIDETIKQKNNDDKD